MKYRCNAAVVQNLPLGDDIFDMWIEAADIAACACPGQFLALYPEDPTKLLPRPISICEIDRTSGRLRLVYRVAGAGTREFSARKPGDFLDVMGPLGNGFPLENPGRALIVGGGIGVPPLLELAKSLPGEKVLAMGYRSRTYLEDDLRAASELIIATEDGSKGTLGNVLDAIRENNVQADVIFACGPLPMLRAVKAFALEKNIPCYVSMEERMACGVGACLACVCQTEDVDEHSQVHNRRICKEGPVFDAREVVL